MRICAIRVSFQGDDDESTSGNGQFIFSTDGIDCGNYTIDPPPHNRSYFESQLKAVDSYFSAVSYGKFGIDLENSTVYPYEEISSYSLPNSMNYYNPYDQDDIQEIRITGLLSDAVQIAYEIDQVDFSSYDHIVIFHAGIGQDFSLPFLDPTPEDIPSTFVDNDMIFNSLGTSSIIAGVHQIKQGIILPETQNHLLFDIAESMFSDALEPCEYQYGLTGTFALMLGFATGFPPLWNIETGESGVGIFGLMDQGSNNGIGVIPAPPTAWTRMYAGWDIPIEVSFNTEIELPSRSENNLVRININKSEYFLIENRDHSIKQGISLDSMRYVIYEESGKNEYPPLINVLQDSVDLQKDENGVIISVPNYDIGLPASGLLIWHIDETIINAGIKDYTVNSNLSRLGIDLEEADGAQDIGYISVHIFNNPSVGYFGDVWFKGNTQYELANTTMEGMNPEFGPFTYPSTKSNNGSSSFIKVSDISESDSIMTFSVSNNLIRSGFPINNGEIIQSFNASENPMILGISDSLWIAPINTLSNRIYFHDQKPFYKIFTIIDEQENHTFINVYESPILYPDYSGDSYIKYETRYDYHHPTNTITRLFTDESSWGFGGTPIWNDSLIYLNSFEWDSHSTRVFTSSFTYDIGIGNSGIARTDFDGTIINWEDISFKSISGVDLNMDANPDVLALDSSGYLYAFNSELMLLSGFPINEKLQSPILTRDLINDGYPEIVAKSADSSSIYIFDHMGNTKYKIISNRDDDVIGLKSITQKNSIITKSIIYQFGEETETNGNNWSFHHGDWGRNRKIELGYSFDFNIQSHHIRSYCYPNPIFDNIGTIRIETVDAENIEINLYDLAGYYIKTWKNEFINSGNQISEWVWDVYDIESGVYFAHIGVYGQKGISSNIIKIAVIH